MSDLYVYWDASALASALVRDEHTDVATDWAEREGLHLMSSLAEAELCAVLARARREGLLTDVLAESALETLDTGPWRRLEVGPSSDTLRRLSLGSPLRGADLWHVAMAVDVSEDIPELRLLTFDGRMREAAEPHGLIDPDG